MAPRPNTRGKTVELPAYIVPTTRVEQREKRETAAKKKAQDKAETENKMQAKHAASTTRIAEFMDKQAEKDKDISGINPDFQVSSLPCLSRSH